MKTVEKIVDSIFSGIDDSLYDREEAIDLIEIYAKSQAGQHETIVIGSCEHKNKKWISEIAETYCPSCREIL